MLFCPKCGSIMTSKSKNGKQLTICNCGYVSREKLSSLREEIKQKPSEVEIVEKEEVETLPLIEADCPKCEHKKAFYWTLQTRAADEGETKFLKCEKCKHIWRDYG